MSTRTYYLVFISLLFLYSCKQGNETNGELSTSWELITNQFNDKDLCESNLQITNNGESAITNDFRIYFNFCRYIHPELSSGPFKIEHINGDFFRLSLKPNIKIQPGQTISQTLVSDYWAIKESDAPSGLYAITNSYGNYDTILLNLEIKPFQSAQQINRTKNDILKIPTPQSRFEKNFPLTNNSAQIIPIIPTPKDYKLLRSKYNIKEVQQVYTAPELKIETDLLTETLKTFGIKIHKSKTDSKSEGIRVLKKDLNFSKHPEAYELIINQNGITIITQNQKGYVNATQSLNSILYDELKIKKSHDIQGIHIKDAPSLDYRGLHVDIARNFKTKEGLMRLIDIMSMYKLNKLHLHFCDDEAWRIEIPELPELTTIGAYRFHSDDPSRMLPHYGSGPYKDNSIQNGYYSKEDFIQLIKFAKQRNIDIIPEIDLPGHARAAIKSMESRYLKLKEQGDMSGAEEYLLTDFKDKSEYRSVQNFNDNVVNPAMESTYRFIDRVCKTLVSFYKEAGVEPEIFHIGGDEIPKNVWTKSPKVDTFLATNEFYTQHEDLKFYFLKRTNLILKKYGLTTAGWEEIVLKENNGSKEVNPDFVNEKLIPFIWNNMWNWGAEDLGYKIANKGYPIVLNSVTNLYFDMAYDKDPKEPGYYWGNFTNTKSAFDFTPYNVLESGNFDNLGHKIDKSKYQGNFSHLSKTGTKNIHGIQGLIWSETTITQDQLEYMVFPKLLGLAERAWNPELDNIDQALKSTYWNNFAYTLGHKELNRLDDKKINYRIPLPGAIIKNDTLYANSTFPGLSIRYTLDGSEPTSQSKLYTEPIKVNSKNIKLKCFNSKNRSSRTSTL